MKQVGMVSVQRMSTLIGLLSVLVIVALDYQGMRSRVSEQGRRLDRLESELSKQGSAVTDLDRRMIRIEEKQDLILERLEEIVAKF